MIQAWLSQITVGEVILAMFATALTRDILVMALPDTVAGPGGWLIDTASRGQD